MVNDVNGRAFRRMGWVAEDTARAQRSEIGREDTVTIGEVTNDEVGISDIPNRRGFESWLG